MEVYVSKEKVTWRRRVFDMDSHGVDFAVEMNGFFSKESQEQIIAAAESFSEQVKRILEGVATAADTSPAPDNSETPGQSLDLDREQRLRMIAQAVEGMTYLDWKRASHQIGRMFAHPATVASNRAVIGKTLEEIADTIENERM